MKKIENEKSLNLLPSPLVHHPNHESKTALGIKLPPPPAHRAPSLPPQHLRLCPLYRLHCGLVRRQLPFPSHRLKLTPHRRSKGLLHRFAVISAHRPPPSAWGLGRGWGPGMGGGGGVYEYVQASELHATARVAPAHRIDTESAFFSRKYQCRDRGRGGRFNRREGFLDLERGRNGVTILPNVLKIGLSPALDIRNLPRCGLLYRV